MDYDKKTYCVKTNEKTETVFPGTNPEVQSPFALSEKGGKAMNRNCSPSAIGRRIADLRREVGLTQGELAEKADISVVHLSNIELGKKTPGLSTLIRIAEALDVATDWILRANTPGTYAVANEKIGELLADCTNDEMLSILRILEEVKKAMRHN